MSRYVPYSFTTAGTGVSQSKSASLIGLRVEMVEDDIELVVVRVRNAWFT